MTGWLVVAALASCACIAIGAFLLAPWAGFVAAGALGLAAVYVTAYLRARRSGAAS